MINKLMSAGQTVPANLRVAQHKQVPRVLEANLSALKKDCFENTLSNSKAAKAAPILLGSVALAGLVDILKNKPMPAPRFKSVAASPEVEAEIEKIVKKIEGADIKDADIKGLSTRFEPVGIPSLKEFEPKKAALTPRFEPCGIDEAFKNVNLSEEELTKLRNKNQFEFLLRLQNSIDKNK